MKVRVVMRVVLLPATDAAARARGAANRLNCSPAVLPSFVCVFFRALFVCSSELFLCVLPSFVFLELTFMPHFSLFLSPSYSLSLSLFLSLSLAVSLSLSCSLSRFLFLAHSRARSLSPSLSRSLSLSCAGRRSRMFTDRKVGARGGGRDENRGGGEVETLNAQS